MADKLKQIWDYLNNLMDVPGDSIMAVMSAVFVTRVALAAFGKPPLTASESAFYASAIASFAYSNKGPKQS